MSEDRRRALADYDEMADLYADDAAVDPLKVSYDRPTILAMAGDVHCKRVLDVGCASGGLSEGFVERGASVVGIDLNPRLIERARERLGSRAEFQVADIAAPLAFESGLFDVVAASLVLHYLKDWGTPLREFARILRPGGLLVLSTHHPTQDVMIATPPAPYFETVLLTDTWRKGGQEFQVRFYHRPISAIVDALADAGMSEATRKPGSKPPRRYSWSLRLGIDDPRLRSLDLEGFEGLEYARCLARAARYRRLEALENGIAPPAFGVKELAAHEDVSPAHILNRIKQARIQLFGKDLSDSAIYYQLRRPQPSERPCAEESCLFALPRHAPSHRRYCFLHTGVRARVRRHRRRAKAGS